MGIEWPRERQDRGGRGSYDGNFKSRNEFVSLIATFPIEPSQILRECIDKIHGDSLSVNELSVLALGAYSEKCSDTDERIGLMLLVLACAAAIEECPDILTWKKIRVLMGGSWEIENWLSEGMIAYSDRNDRAVASFVNLAKNALLAVSKGELDSQWNQHNEARKGSLVQWADSERKLDDIWSGLTGYADFSNYMEERALVNIFSELDPEGFTSFICNCNDPFLVRASLFYVGVGGFSSRFHWWEVFVVNAPVAFDAKGSWIGSFLVPWLLVCARNEIMQSARELPGLFGGVDRDVEEIKKDIRSIAENVVGISIGREDGRSLLARWSAWIMRQILIQGEAALRDPRNSAFVDELLIDVIGSKMIGPGLIRNAPEDASDWEPWAYRCVLSSHAHSGYTNPPEVAEFVAEWGLSPDDWCSEKGEELVARARHLTLRGEEMPGLAGGLLAYPIAVSDAPEKLWIEMWDSAFTIREVVEFGEVMRARDGYQERMKASELLILLFSIGLSVFDQVVDKYFHGENCRESLAEIHKALALAARDMYEVDDTLGRDKWRLAVRHLAVRRALYGRVSEGVASGEGGTALLEGDKPSLSDYLLDAKSDAFELVGILASITLNTPESPELLDALNRAEVDVRVVLDEVRRLNKYHPRKYPINERQLGDISRLIRVAQA